MQISARVQNRSGSHDVLLSTDGSPHTVTIPPRASGFGSRANGGELLFLALATCYCNDIYREGARLGIAVHEVEVEVMGEFGGPGEPVRGITYRARVVADADAEAIRALMAHTDTVAEIQNSLRLGVPVALAGVEAVSAAG